MTDRAGILAGCADVLTEMCAYYVIAGLMIMSRRGWGLHLFWLLLCAAAAMLIFGVLLKKPRGTPLLTAVTCVIFAATLTVYLLASTTPAAFGYIFVLCIGAGMSVGLPLYYCFHRPDIHSHLVHLDVLVLALAGLLLTKSVLGIDNATAALMIAVLLLVVSAAVALRMSDGCDSGLQPLRASLVALAAAVGVFLVVLLLSSLFSHSGGAVTAFFRTVGAFFAAIGTGIGNFFRWLSALIKANDADQSINIENEIPSTANVGGGGEAVSLSVNGPLAAVIAAVIVITAAVVIAVLLRKKKFSSVMSGGTVVSVQTVTRTKSPVGRLWARFLEQLHFRLTVFRNRNTPAGILLRVERIARRRRVPRLPGESMRHFLTRMDGNEGGLAPLCDALDRQYYGGQTDTLTTGACRRLKKYIRKTL